MTAFLPIAIPGTSDALWIPPFQDVSIQIAPFWTYRPPTSPHEVDLWSAVHRRCLTATKHIAQKILPAGNRPSMGVEVRAVHRAQLAARATNTTRPVASR